MSILFNRKCCATCAFWSGPREADSFGSHAVCKNSNDVGNCSNSLSPFNRHDTKADYGHCGKWERWPALPNFR
jgi:hypothetical protein